MSRTAKITFGVLTVIGFSLLFMVAFFFFVNRPLFLCNETSR